MLNLLIAIISETFATVQGNAENAGYQEKAKMIYDSGFLIPMGTRSRHCEANTYLLFVQRVTAAEQSEDKDDEDLNRMEILKKILKKVEGKDNDDEWV